MYLKGKSAATAFFRGLFLARNSSHLSSSPPHLKLVLLSNSFPLQLEAGRGEGCCQQGEENICTLLLKKAYFVLGNRYALLLK